MEEKNQINSANSRTIEYNIKDVENVLILQGGGSLGAFGCGVFKALTNNNIHIDIVAGTSIGGINAAIIAGNKESNGLKVEEALEQFWLELAEDSPALNFPLSNWIAKSSSAVFEPFGAIGKSDLGEDKNEDNGQQKERNQPHPPFESLLSFYKSTLYGNKDMFLPRWLPKYAFNDPNYFTPNKWTFIYDHSPLLKTLDKYIDYTKLQPNGKSNTRLVITAVNVLTAEPLIFDSSKQQITTKHLLATSGYPLYYFPWIEVEDNIYAWDGSLLSNTPVREVIEVSPIVDKIFFIVENYPKKINQLPQNLPEVLHRARDIMFSDKTMHNVKMSKVITGYLHFIDELYGIFERYTDHSQIDDDVIKKIRNKYCKFKQNSGAEIKHIHYITREEKYPHYYENADFSVKTIKQTISDGETKTNEALKRYR